MKATLRAKEHIEAGDVYQVCLTRRAELAFDGDPWLLYRGLREVNPAPFAAYLALDDVTVLSCSPERFLSLSSDRRVESRPIKGTRPRGSDPASDRAQERSLRTSQKDRAENLMIVDLVRNDLGRVCETGSVRVPELMKIESYATVFQMVSTVCGRLRSDCDAFDLLRSAFPPGSMTGAPKLAAMAILDRLEPVRRGIYSGALGFLDLRGGAELSVVIRALFLKDGCAYVHSGGGIVADSLPAEEWRETQDKVGVLLAAIAAASECGS
jgi:aminodeoxychorismate synthase component I